MTEQPKQVPGVGGDPYTEEYLREAYAAEGEEPVSVEVELVELVGGPATPEAKIDLRQFNKGGPGRNRVPIKPYIPDGTDPADRPFHNLHEEVPSWIEQTYKREKPIHRLIAFLSAQGLSGVKIAEQLGVSPHMVYATRQLPWVKELVREEIKRNGREAVKEILSVTAPELIQTLVGFAHDDKLQTRDRITAIKELLDRKFGKPNQPMSVTSDVDLAKLSDDELMKYVAQRTAN